MAGAGPGSYGGGNEIVKGGDENLSKTREKRLPFEFKNGAIYDGDWVGNDRDGYGI